MLSRPWIRPDAPPAPSGARAVGRWLVQAFVAVAVAVFTANLVGALGLHLKHTISAATTKPVDRRARLPAYDEFGWAETHFREFGELAVTHHSYYGWRRRPYQGETITIDAEGTRATYADPNAEPTRTIGFFGGSTTWGSGADDAHTIPSLFARMRPEFRAFNFGETAHTAHQNLNYLIKVLADGLRPDVVVFYNGSSEIHKCRVGLTWFSNVDEPRIRRFLDDEVEGLRAAAAAWSLIEPARRFAEVAKRSIEARLRPGAVARDCADDPAKTEQIARTMLWDWFAAKHLVEGYGGRFVAALQPVAYFSAAVAEHVRIRPDLARQYHSLYPLYAELLRREFPALEANFLDLRNAFDRHGEVYIDADHASPRGNAIIASRISAYLGD